MDIRSFVREYVATRPVIAGALAALAVGLLVGAHLSPKAVFEPKPPMQPVVVKPVAPPQPITFMTDATGRVPEYVVGTDNIPGRRAPPAREVAEEAPPEPERGRARWFWPPSWFRGEARREREDWGYRVPRHDEARDDRRRRHAEDLADRDDRDRDRDEPPPRRDR